MSRNMRVAIVNDSKLAAESLRRVVASSDHYEIAWVAEDGAAAVQRSQEDRPDLILMDLIMPVMDGVAATREIMAKSPCAIVVVTASVAGNAAKVFEAMGAGALDAINTPVLGMDGSGAGATTLLHKIDMVARLIQAPKSNRETAPRPTPYIPCTASNSCPPLIAIGASTGGPAALQKILAALPADLPAAIILIQHVDEEFARSFSEWLNDQTPLTVRLAQPGDRPTLGQVLVAGREDHLVLSANGTLQYTAEPADYAYRPSVNVFFESMASHWRGQSIGVLLTGMGRDGGTGLLSLRQSGAHTIAQDQASSAIYGMPKAAAELSAAIDILGLDNVSAALLKCLKRPLTA